MANMDYFYDAQLRRYLLQFMRIFSEFKVSEGKRNGVTYFNKTPVRYADMQRMVAHIIKQGSENMVNSTPFMAVSIQSLLIARDRTQDPMLVATEQIAEREYDTGTASYKSDQGNLYSTKKIMPVPYNLTLNVDCWTANTDQKMQLLEQILILFNPSLQLQQNSNPLDWTQIFEVELTDIQWSNRSIPAGVDETIDVATLTFTLPIWLSPPAQVKRQKIINTITTNVYNTGSLEDLGYDDDIYDFFRSIEGDMEINSITPNNYWVDVSGTEATLYKSAPTSDGSVYDDGTTVKANWNDLLEVLAPQGASGTISGSGVSIADIPLTTGSTLQLNITNELENTSLITGTVTRNAIDSGKLIFTVDADTLPANTETDVTRIVDPLTNHPGDGTLDAVASGQRYLLTNEIVGDVWGITADINDIIQYDGSKWSVVFDASTISISKYVKNTYTNKQYRWNGETWSSTHEGTYNPGYWKLNI
ncbi:tail sheath stabilizer and completion protein [bacterium]|nr:tail sheath stabilizer and completion protein [bacterium]